MFCTKCGAELKEGARFCAQCGAEISAAGAAAGVGQSVPPKQGQAVTGIKKKSTGRLLAAGVSALALIVLGIGGVLWFRAYRGETIDKSGETEPAAVERVAQQEESDPVQRVYVSPEEESRQTQSQDKTVLVETIDYDADGSISDAGWIEYSYDAAGKLTKETNYDCNSGGGIREWYEYSYDAAGKLTRETYYDFEGSISSWIEYTYAPLGVR